MLSFIGANTVNNGMLKVVQAQVKLHVAYNYLSMLNAQSARLLINI
jgi:hypothetical protein